MATALYKPAVGDAVRAAWIAGQSGIIDGDAARQGLLACAVHTEELAARAGFATPIAAHDEHGQPIQGYVIGGGRPGAIRAARAGSREAIVYLAAHASLRRSVAEIAPATSADLEQTAAMMAPDYEQAIAPIVIVVALIVIGLAATAWAVAWAYATKVRVAATTANRERLTQTAVDLASSGKAIDPKSWALLSQMAGQEADASAPGSVPWGWVAGGAAVVGGLWYLASRPGGVSGAVRRLAA